VIAKRMPCHVSLALVALRFAALLVSGYKVTGYCRNPVPGFDIAYADGETYIPLQGVV
jgi:hypothetical protein